MKRIAIIGGGVSGLSAAFHLEELRRQGAKFEYSVLEASARLGGVLRSEKLDDCLVEAGPDCFSAKNHGLRICAAARTSAINSLGRMTPSAKPIFLWTIGSSRCRMV